MSRSRSRFNVGLPRGGLQALIHVPMSPRQSCLTFRWPFDRNRGHYLTKKKKRKKEELKPR